GGGGRGAGGGGSGAGGELARGRAAAPPGRPPARARSDRRRGVPLRAPGAAVSGARAATVLLALVLAVACGPRERVETTAQVILYVDTDAPVPTLAGAASDAQGARAPLFDRVRIEFLPPGNAAPCDGCSNTF